MNGIKARCGISCMFLTARELVNGEDQSGPGSVYQGVPEGTTDSPPELQVRDEATRCRHCHWTNHGVVGIVAEAGIW